MIGIIACVLAFVACWASARRSLGDGLGVTLTCGYFFGILRANFLDGATHFFFDAASLGLYVGLFRHSSPGGDALARKWLLPLVGWPALVLFVPHQHFLVQLVGLRAAIFFLPYVVIGARLSESDLMRLARWLAVLNLLALLFGALEYTLGVARFFPYNAVTEIIYRSGDVGADRHLRIPATFGSAHAYGGMMIASLPVLLAGLLGAKRARDAALQGAGTFAAAIGVFLCAARQPAIYLFALGAYVLFVVRLSSARRMMALLLIVGIGAVVVSSDRFQRFTTLSDTEGVVSRIEASANLSFLELVVEHPMGEGLGSAAGTSIPYFLADVARPQIGMENEWGRIALEQSLIGLALWLTFVVSTLARMPRGGRAAVTATGVGRRLMWAYVGLAWGTAFIGTGMLTSIPTTAMTLLFMGALWRVTPSPAAPTARRVAPATPARATTERVR